MYGHLTQAIQKHHPSMVILRGTKVESVSNNHTFKFLMKSCPSNVMVPSNGHGVGLWVCWDPMSMDACLIDQSSQHITLSRTFKVDKVARGLLTAIYASPNWQVHCNLWESLLYFHSDRCSSETPWILIGDFNLMH